MGVSRDFRNYSESKSFTAGTRSQRILRTITRLFTKKQERSFEIFFRIGKHTRRAVWSPRGMFDELEHRILETFGAMHIYSAVDERDPYFLVLKPSGGIRSMDTDYGLGPMEADTEGSPRGDIWMLLCDPKVEIKPGSVITVADPAWRAVLFLGLQESWGFDFLGHLVQARRAREILARGLAWDRMRPQERDRDGAQGIDSRASFIGGLVS